MLPVGTERQSNEIALVRLIAQPLIGIIDDLIRFQIEHRDRLMGEGLLRAVAGVQQGSVASIRTDYHSRGKAVGAADSSGRREGQHFAGGEHDGRTILGGCLRKNSSDADEAEYAA